MYPLSYSNFVVEDKTKKDERESYIFIVSLDIPEGIMNTCDLTKMKHAVKETAKKYHLL